MFGILNSSENFEEFLKKSRDMEQKFEFYDTICFSFQQNVKEYNPYLMSLNEVSMNKKVKRPKKEEMNK